MRITSRGRKSTLQKVTGTRNLISESHHDLSKSLNCSFSITANKNCRDSYKAREHHGYLKGE